MSYEGYHGINMTDPDEKPDIVLAIYDDGGKTIDRYTIVYDESEKDSGFYSMVGSSGNPFHPQGFFQHTDGIFQKGAKNSHLGKEIKWKDLPTPVQRAIIRDCTF